MASSQSSELHFVLFPLMAPGHMIPMIDIAKLLAQRSVNVSIITTPQNSSRFASTVARASESGLRIRTLEVRFPSVEAGLPENCENLDALPSLDMAANFFVALSLLKSEVEHKFQELEPRPSCLISDMGLPWTTQIAEKFNVPRIVFHGTCCFSLLCSHNVRESNILDALESDTEEFEVPNLPDKIRLRKCHLAGSMTRKPSTLLKDVADQIKAAEKAAYGVIVNSFEELEEEYVKEYSKAKGEKVWCVGPVSLCNKDGLDLVERGSSKASSGEHGCLKWLDRHEPGSVVYASLGSLARLSTSQMIELALGLEASKRPFLWALGGGKLEELEKWFSEKGFEERTKNRSFLIRDWAPQLMILSHHAIGGFLTHCGWNSSLEGVSFGVPMVTWPLFAEQFCNEKLIVEVLKIGVSIGTQVPVKWGEEDKVGVLVKRDDVVRALEKLMDEGDEGRERRRMRAKGLGEKAMRAVEEGGSSHANVTSLIQEIMGRSSK